MGDEELQRRGPEYVIVVRYMGLSLPVSRVLSLPGCGAIELWKSSCRGVQPLERFRCLDGSVTICVPPVRDIVKEVRRVLLVTLTRNMTFFSPWKLSRRRFCNT